MHISVIFPTKNGGDLFRESLKMVFSQDIDLPIEIIVVDSGSTDQTLQICSEYPIKLIQISPSSFNHSSTRNLAISSAKGEICVLTVQDAIPVDRKWLATLVQPLLKKEKIAGVFGQQVSRIDASPLSRCCKLLWYQEWRKDWEEVYEQLPVQPDEWSNFTPEKKKEYARFDNVNSCIRRSVWRKIPFPDIRYAEDIAWASKVLTSGYSIFWQPNAKVYHSHERSLAYAFMRSYVDMKILSSMLGNSSLTMTHKQARSLIGWLAQETYRFLPWVSPRKEHDIGIITEVDSLWQSQCRGLAFKEPQGKKPYLGFFFRRNIKNVLLHYFFLSLAGPEWFRRKCRRIFDQKHHLTSSNALFLTEIRGRHRFFLNKLLQIHFAQDCITMNSAHSIRLGAAAMVGGSFLGQHMGRVDCMEKLSDKASTNTGKVQYITQREFWQALSVWYNQKWRREEDALLQLDQLLTAGV